MGARRVRHRSSDRDKGRPAISFDALMPWQVMAAPLLRSDSVRVPCACRARQFVRRGCLVVRWLALQGRAGAGVEPDRGMRFGRFAASDLARAGAQSRDDLGPALQFEFAQDVVHVRFGGAKAHAQAPRDGLVRQAIRYQVQYLQLARRKRGG